MNKYQLALLFVIGVLAIIQVQEPPASLHPDDQEISSRGPIEEDEYKENGKMHDILLMCVPEDEWIDNDDNMERGIVA